VSAVPTTNSAVHPPFEGRCRVGPRAAVLSRNTLPSLVVAAAVGWWLWRTVPHDAVRAALLPVRVGVVAAALAAWGACFVTVEVVGLGMVWRRHLVPTLAWRDAASLVCGKMILSPLVPGLTKLVPIAAFWRRARLPPTRVLGAGEIINASEVAVLISLATVGIVLGGVGAGAVVWSGLAGYWSFILGLIALRCASARVRLLSRIGRLALFAPWMATRAHEALQILSLRALLAVSSISCIGVILREVGIALAPLQALAFAALLLFASFLPISVGGYGGPQGVAVLVLAHDWNLCSPARAVSASLVWATGTLVVQLCAGTLALPRLWGLVRSREAWRG
jgi:hypothetical protein